MIICVCVCYAGLKQEEYDESGEMKRKTVSIRLSMFAAHNAFHHCEQCHHYSEPGPARPVSLTLTLSRMHTHTLE